MPNCKNCNNHFPNRIKINGQMKNTSGRKYCLTCSPFGLHNTRAFGYVRKTQTKRECKICGKLYKAKGTVCPSCNANSRRFEIKLMAISYLGGSCASCGYNKCPAALVFHHVNPENKEFTFGGHHGLSFQRIKNELDKCVLLCNRCHAEHHWEEEMPKRMIILERIKK